MLNASDRRKAPAASNKGKARTGSANLPALNPHWLAGQTYDLQAGLLLSALRRRLDISQRELGKRIGAGRSLIAMWEQGRSSIPHDRLRDLNKALALSTKDAGKLETAWKLKKEVDYSPKLDPQWIAGHPRQLQAGLWLCGFRMRKGLQKKKLAGIIGRCSTTVAHWEQGKYRIPYDLLAALQAALELTAEDTQKLRDALGGIPPVYSHKQLARHPRYLQAGLLLSSFRKRARFSQRALGEKVGVVKILIYQWEKGITPIPRRRVGALKEALRLSVNDVKELDNAIGYPPAFDPDWLAQQPVYLQAGLLLCAFRTQMGIYKSELGKTLGVGKAIIYQWETGRSPIPPRRVSAIKEALGLSTKDTQRLKKAMDISGNMLKMHRKQPLPKNQFNQEKPMAKPTAVKSPALLPEKQTRLPVVDNPSAPDFYADEVLGFLLANNTLRITLASVRTDHSKASGTNNCIVTGRLVLPLQAAQQLHKLLGTVLEKVKTQPLEKDARAETLQ